MQKKLSIWYGVSGPKLLERAANRRVPLTASSRHSNTELKEHFARYTDVETASVISRRSDRSYVRRSCSIGSKKRYASARAEPTACSEFTAANRRKANVRGPTVCICEGFKDASRSRTVGWLIAAMRNELLLWVISIDGVCAMSAVHPISTELPHYGDRRSGPTAESESRRYTVLIPGVPSKIRPRNCPNQSYVHRITDSGPAPGVGD